MKEKRFDRFSSVRLKNWRNFSSVDVELSSRVFLVGPNASGKSNFLDAFRFLHDIVAIGGGFQKAVQKRGGVSGLRALFARRAPNIEIQVQVSIGANDWVYELHFTQHKKNQPIVDRPMIKKEVVVKNGEKLLERPDAEDRKDPQRLTETSIEQVNANRPYRELFDFFDSVRYQHLVPQLIRDSERYVGREDDPFGGNFLEKVAGTEKRDKKVILKRIGQALSVAVPQLKEIRQDRDVKGKPHLSGKYSHWRSRGAWQGEEQFSDGTLRLMGLLWAMLEPGGPLLLEEPELSLHAKVVRFLPQLFARMQTHSGRQILISTHSAELLRDTGIGLDEVFMLKPSSEGTEVVSIKHIAEARLLLESGDSLADIVIPQTAPSRAEQLTFFDMS